MITPYAGCGGRKGGKEGRNKKVEYWKAAFCYAVLVWWQLGEERGRGLPGSHHDKHKYTTVLLATAQRDFGLLLLHLFDGDL
jgi:hypothetical protein